MTKTKQPQKRLLRMGPLPTDDPIYKSGYIMMRPIHGRKQEKAKTGGGGENIVMKTKQKLKHFLKRRRLASDEPTVSAESSDSTSTDQKCSGSGN